MLSDYESITIGTSQATATKMQYDGFLIKNTSGEADSSVYTSSDGGATWFVYLGTIADMGKCKSVVVRKGDLVYVSSSGTTFVRYYKLRDYTDR